MGRDPRGARRESEARGVSNRGRSTTGEGKPYHPSTPDKEAAKHLRLTTARYLADRASFRDVENAWKTFAHAFLKVNEA